MAKIHHATAKFAAKHSLALVENGDSFEVRTVEGNLLVDAGKDPKALLHSAIDQIKEYGGEDYEASLAECIGQLQEEDEANTDEADAADEEIEDDEPKGKSIVKRKYKTAYKPFKNTCGDDFSDLMNKAIKYSVKLDGKTVKRVDYDKLKKLAKLNGVWDPNYEHLNMGQKSMNVRNRLRHKAKKGEEIKWL